MLGAEGDNMSKGNTSFGKLNVLRLVKKQGAHVHFLGVGGVGMSGLFRLSAHFGIKTSGSDRAHGEYVDALLRSGADVEIGSIRLPRGVDMVVFTTAAADDDPIIAEAQRLGVPCVSRAEYLGALMLCYGVKIGVSGTHGKSTTTAMLNSILKRAEKRPTTLCGASICDGCSVEVGALDYLVYEACEYKDSFLSFSPDLALFLNLEYDHPDYFKDMDSLCTSFYKAMSAAGRVIVNADDEKLLKIAKKLDTSPILFGKGENCDYRYSLIPAKGRGVSFDLYRTSSMLGRIDLPVIGDFNAANAAAAACAALECGVCFEDCRAALSSFTLIPRRLERVGEVCGRDVFYDYAHHPTEIKSSIEAIKGHTGGAVTVVFGAHTYSRTAALWSEFVAALRSADYVIIRKISAIREQKIDGVSAEQLARECGGVYAESVCALPELIGRTEGAIVVMGAADMSEEKNTILGVDKNASWD